MREQPDRLEDYPLFYEEIGRHRQGGRALKQTKKEASYERCSLSERQVAKLSDDLRRPIKTPPPTPSPQ